MLFVKSKHPFYLKFPLLSWESILYLGFLLFPNSNKLHFTKTQPILINPQSSIQGWPSPFQKRAGFNEHQGLRQKIRTNAKDTARQCGQILSVLIFLLCKQSNQNNN